MSDGELLQLAAKAEGRSYIKNCVWIENGFYSPLNRHERIAWNPLQNDGDAFCLMLALGLRLEYFSLDPFEVSGQPVCVITWAPGGERNRLCQTLTETGDEAHAVVRRAIVRAAAKIGGKVK